MRGYRFVTDDLKSKNGEVQWEIGKWQKHDGELKLCKSGFHASKEPLDSLNYVFGSRWFICEARGKILEDDDKFCAEEMRLLREIPDLKRLMVRFAVDCAKRCLPRFEAVFPEDECPREAIEAAEVWFKNPTEENRRAAESAAESAAWSAAWLAAEPAWSSVGAAAESARSAARAAARSAWSARSAGSATRLAAWSAAESAAWSAGAAAGSAGLAERKWQRKHLNKLIKETKQ